MLCLIGSITNTHETVSGGPQLIPKNAESTDYSPSIRIAETIAKLATIAMIAVCPQLIPIPTRKKPNTDQPAKMTHFVSGMVAAHML